MCRRDGGSHHLAWSSLDNSAFLRQPSSRHAKLIATQRKPTKGSQNSTEQAGAPTPPPISLSLPMGKHRPSHVVGTPSHPLSSSDIELATGRNIFQSAAKPATQHGARVVGARSLFQPTTQPTTSQGVRLAGSSSLFKPTTQQTTENEIELSRSKGLLEATGMPARNRIFEENPHISKPDVQKSGHRNPQRRSIDFNQRSISTDLQPLQSHARRSFDLIRAQHNGYSGASSTPIDSASERQVLPPLVAYP